MPKKIEISHRTIIFTVFFILLLFGLYQIRDILLTLFISFCLMSAINPFVVKMERLKIPRFLGIGLFYVLILSVVSLTVAGILPPLIDQTSSLISQLPSFIDSINLPTIDGKILTSQLSQLGSIPGNIVKITAGIFGNITAFLVVAVITFYFLLERKNLDRYFSLLFDENGRNRAALIWAKLENKLGSWVRAQFFLMVIVGVLCYVGLRILGIEFALPLAILAGVLEIVPNIGPILSAVPAVLSALTISPVMGLAVAALYFLVQQLENALIVPQVMAKEIGLRPLLVIIILAIGAKLAGLAGVILGIPIFLFLQVVLTEAFAFKKSS